MQGKEKRVRKTKPSFCGKTLTYNIIIYIISNSICHHSFEYNTTMRTPQFLSNLVTWACRVNLWKRWRRIREGGALAKWKCGSSPHSSDLGVCPAWVGIMSRRRKHEKMRKFEIELTHASTQEVPRAWTYHENSRRGHTKKTIDDWE